jgi:hypothetical protein
VSNEHLKSPKVRRTMESVGAIMADRITPLFTAGALVTVIVRFPDNDEADFFMSDRAETLADLRRFLDRCEGRDGLEHDTIARAAGEAAERIGK